MKTKNVEFKAKVDDLSFYEEKLKQLGAYCEGSFKQADTYFNAKVGRLKLREYEDYSSLIYYNRENVTSSKESEVIYYKHETNYALLDILKLQLGVKVYVEKVRVIYKVDNVSIHLDTVHGLGTFIEVEAEAKNESYTAAKLEEQCNYYYALFQLTAADLVAPSYSDLLLVAQHNQ
ncbi:MAG: class IV adenylate cyclase [Flavobacteriaceae bacterium]|jgi:predicted adenylyl cyclase CyaB|nr:class IV adenylate cyclase [Flavobacteriaceae bacterium]